MSSYCFVLSLYMLAMLPLAAREGVSPGVAMVMELALAPSRSRSFLTPRVTAPGLFCPRSFSKNVRPSRGTLMLRQPWSDDERRVVGELFSSVSWDARR